MRILVCVKRVPAPGAKINITADAQDVDTAHLGFAMSPHEECAVEEAVQLIEANGGPDAGHSATVLTLGPAEAEEQLRYSASLGIQHAVLLKTDGSPWDPQRTAQAIASAVETLESEGGAFDLILFGNESADSGGFQVGIRVAHAIGRPIVNAIKGIEPDFESGEVTAKRDIDGGFEVYGMQMPAVFGVKEGLNLPRYPTMRGRLASKKIEVTVLDAEGDEGGQQRVRLQEPPQQESTTVHLGEGTAAVPAIVDLLDELGVLHHA